MIRIVFFVILFLFVARALRGLWGGILEGLNQPATPRGGVPSRGVPMVRDPVCGTFVVPERAVSLSVGREHRVLLFRRLSRRLSRATIGAFRPC